MSKTKLYTYTYKVNERVKNRGYKYQGKILKKTLSQYLYNFKHLSSFLNKLEVAITHFFDSVKTVKNYINYTVEKDDTNIK